MGEHTAAVTSIADSKAAAALRAWAKGSYPTEAAVELLIRHGRAVYDGAPWIQREGERAWLEADALRDASGAWSGGERRIVDIALSMLGEEPVDLSEALPGLDRRNLDLVLAAVSHAGGSHEHTDIRYNADGHVSGFGRNTLPALHPWPEA